LPQNSPYNSILHAFRRIAPFLPISGRPPILHHPTTIRHETRPPVCGRKTIIRKQQTGSQQGRAAPVPHLPRYRKRRDAAGAARNHARRVRHRERADVPVFAPAAHVAHLRSRLRRRRHPEPSPSHDVVHPRRARGESDESRLGAYYLTHLQTTRQPDTVLYCTFVRSIASWASAGARPS
jgi:hypothetical protein